jgi:hypothetical protein
VTLLDLLKQTFRDILTSKKALATATAILVYITGRFGFAVDPTVLDRIWQALLVYVGAQGVADLGKSAALARSPASSPAITVSGGGGGGAGSAAAAVAALALVMLAIGGAASLTACTAAQRAELRQDTAAGVVAFLGCEGAHFDAAVLADAKAALAGKVSGWITGSTPGELEALERKMLAELEPVRSDLFRCAVADGLNAALAAASSPAAPAASSAAPRLAALAAPRSVDVAMVGAAFALAARQLGWQPVRMVSGGDGS